MARHAAWLALADGPSQVNHVEPHFSPANDTLPFKHPPRLRPQSNGLCARLK